MFSVDWGDAFYTIYTFYAAIICVGLRGGYFWAGAERGKVNLEFLLVQAELKGIPEKTFMKNRN